MADSGAQALASLGYKQELQRDFTLGVNFAISFTIITILTAVTGLFGLALTYGGPVVIVWGWPMVSLLTFTVTLAMAEICSAMPTSGGLYFWASRLAGKHGAFASWVTGWFNLLGQVAITAGIVFANAQLVAAVILIATSRGYNTSAIDVANAAAVESGQAPPDFVPPTPGYVCNQYVLLGIYAALLIVQALLNMFGPTLIALFNWVSVAWHMLGVVMICILVPALAPNRPSAEWVFTTFRKPDVGIDSSVYIFLLGLLMSQFCLTGYDASAHMSEETKRADVTGPIGMIMAVGAAFVFGWAYCLGLTFGIQDLDSLMDPNTVTQGTYPVGQIFFDAFAGRYNDGSVAGPVLLLVYIGVAMFFAGMSSLTSNGRMLWAFSRDNALPFSPFWRKVSPKTLTPVNAVWGMALLAFLIALPLVKSTVAFTAVTSIATIGLYISYAIPIVLRLTLGRKDFVPGPFNLGPASIPVGIIAVVWVAFITILFVLPTAYPVTEINFNYAPVAVGFVLVFTLSYWFLSARKWFKGPIKNLDQFDDNSFAPADPVLHYKSLDPEVPPHEVIHKVAAK